MTLMQFRIMEFSMLRRRKIPPYGRTCSRHMKNAGKLLIYMATKHVLYKTYVLNFGASPTTLGVLIPSLSTA
jgi:hypothetical protein